MRDIARKVLSGAAMVAITGGVLLWGLSPGMTLKRMYESRNGKPVDSEHVLQEITLPAYNMVHEVTALEARDLQDGMLVLAYPTCPYCRNLMPELVTAAQDTDTTLYYCELNKYRDVYTYASEAAAPVLTTPAGEGYMELLAWLDDYAVDYSIKDLVGNALPIGERRLGAPTIVHIQHNSPVSDWKLSSAEGVSYPKDKYERWDAETQNIIYDSLCRYFTEGK